MKLQSGNVILSLYPASLTNVLQLSLLITMSDIGGALEMELMDILGADEVAVEHEAGDGASNYRVWSFATFEALLFI